MKANVRRQLDKRKNRISKRLTAARDRQDTGQPSFTSRKPKLEVADRTRAMSQGGIVVAHQAVVKSGLIELIDKRLKLLKIHRPYHESDHVLNIAYNALCGGQCLDDIELRRNDEAYLDALQTEAIPDPTTAGDFCRRFDVAAVETLTEVINETRVRIWQKQSPAFFRRATIDVDSTVVPTTGESKQAMGLSYKGVWGFHPLLITLANTGEVLYVVNRSGNRNSHFGAVEYLDKAIKLCLDAGFKEVVLRGDSAFSLTRHFAKWADQGVRFVFSYDAMKVMKDRADGIADTDYHRLVRRAEETFDGEIRARQPRYKEAFVNRKGYENIKLNSEDVAEFKYGPTRADRVYRVVVLRKNLTIKKGDQRLFDDIRYFFYITNDWEMSAAQVVRESNLRCDQEKLIDQLKNGVRALRAPLNLFTANWAYMVMTALAWNIKAWMALMLPISPRWLARHARERLSWLRMGFRSFVNQVIQMPAQVLTTGRQRIVRLLCWKPAQPALFRLLNAL